jgi:hypothetical protein
MNMNLISNENSEIEWNSLWFSSFLRYTIGESAQFSLKVYFDITKSPRIECDRVIEPGIEVNGSSSRNTKPNGHGWMCHDVMCGWQSVFSGGCN